MDGIFGVILVDDINLYFEKRPKLLDIILVDTLFPSDLWYDIKCEPSMIVSKTISAN